MGNDKIQKLCLSSSLLLLYCYWAFFTEFLLRVRRNTRYRHTPRRVISSLPPLRGMHHTSHCFQRTTSSSRRRHNSDGVKGQSWDFSPRPTCTPNFMPLLCVAAPGLLARGAGWMSLPSLRPRGRITSGFPPRFCHLFTSVVLEESANHSEPVVSF